MNSYRFNYKIIGKKRDSIIFRYLSQLLFIFKTIIFVKIHKIDIGMGISMTLPIVGKLTNMKVIGFDDDDMSVTPIFAKYINKSDIVLIPSCLAHENRGINIIKHAGYHELAYLHPNRFVPDEKVLNEAFIDLHEPYFILRFNSFKAHHDVGVKGLSIEDKRKLIEILRPHGKIFITTERQIDPEFKDYHLKIEPHKIHSFLYYATMFIGDSQTMTTEAALLGTPAYKCNSFAGKLSVPNEIEQKYGLCYSFLPEKFDDMIIKINELLTMRNIKQEWQKRRRKMLADKIDVTAFMVWFVENYPESVSIMRENPDYQYNFK